MRKEPNGNERHEKMRAAKTYERHYRHEGTLGAASLYCYVRGSNNYTVASYVGSEMTATSGPTDLVRGGVEAAREAWRNIHRRLTRAGYEVMAGSN